MALKLFAQKGTPIDKQLMSWQEMVHPPMSKLDDDAFTRLRVILMSAIEMESIQFSHHAARLNRDLQLPLAQIRRIDQQQATAVRWLLGADHSPLELTIASKQMALEVTATIAQIETDPYLAQVYRFALLEDLDHLYRYSALMDRLEGKDANNILQSYTDVLPGRPSMEQHRHPVDDLRRPYNRHRASPLSKLHALIFLASHQLLWSDGMRFGPQLSDPLARLLYAEMSSLEEQQITQAESLVDPEETLLERWVLRKAVQIYCYEACARQEIDLRLKALWERFLEDERGQFHFVVGLFEKMQRRDILEVLPVELPEPVVLKNQRDFIRSVLLDEVHLRARGADFVSQEEESVASKIYRQRLHTEGVPSEIVALDYVWVPGGELNHRKDSFLHPSSQQREKKEAPHEEPHSFRSQQDGGSGVPAAHS